MNMRAITMFVGAGTLAAAASAAYVADHATEARSAPVTVVAAPAVEANAARPAPAIPSSAAPVRAAARKRADSGTWWKPAVSDTWQWQLTGRINTSYDVAIYDLDLFDTSDATIAQVHARGSKLICYFSAGSSENWRDDFKEFETSDLGKPLDGWAGERWVDTRSQNVRRIMAKRLDLAAARGCDGVEPDNMDGYANKNGLGLTAADQLDYNRFLATEAHRRGLAVGLKNDLDQVRALVDSFDFAVNEQCAQYRECARLRPFTNAGKPVFNAEYLARYRTNKNGARDTLCAASRAANIRTLVLPLKLNDKYRFSCDS
jgi:hypothetical protein